MITIREAGHDDVATIRALLRDYAASLPFDLAFQGFEAELAALPRPYVAPRGLFLVLREDADVVGIGAYRPLDDDTAELKRMYLVPGARGRGLGRTLVEALIERARASGYRRLRLDTDPASMGPAIALYRSLGFVEIEPYGPDRGGALAFFERVLPDL
jgi:GNAT superfamily N-acetyltransferase